MAGKENDKIKTAVRSHYGRIAESGKTGCGCSSPSCCSAPATAAGSTSTEMGYTETEVKQVPEGADMGLGCGNPGAIASLKRGEVVLDLGSGAGFDCFLAAAKVGEEGKVIGVDMTPEMIDRAKANAQKGGFKNVEFRHGEIEKIPVPDNVIDVIISNCVINLSPEKAKVFQEAFRVLKPGGRLAVSDVVAAAELPEKMKKDIELHASCVAGASLVPEIESMLKDAGFESVEINIKNESKDFIGNWAPGTGIEDYVVSADIRALKPEN